MRAVQTFLLLLFALALNAQTYRLRDPQSARLLITDWTGGVPATAATITFNDPHNLVVNDSIVCQGVLNNVALNTYMRVKTVISPTKISVKDEIGADIIGYSGTKTNVSYMPGEPTAYGSCGKWVPFTFNSHPYGSFAPKDPTLRNRLFGAGGPGSGSGTLQTSDPKRYNQLIDRANLYTSTSCDGSTIATCSVEVNALNLESASLVAGDIPTVIALAWAVTGSTRYRNSGLFYIRNIHRLGGRAGITNGPGGVGGGSWTAHDKLSWGGGWGTSAAISQDYWTFFLTAWVQARDLLDPVMTATDRSEFSAKIFNGSVDGSCTNMMGLLGGEATTSDPDKLNQIDMDTTGRTVGEVLYFQYSMALFKRSDSTLTSVVVSGSTATVNIPTAVTVNQDAGYIVIANSGVTNLDGTYKITNKGAVSAITLSGLSGVADGTYANAGMTAYHYFSSNPGGVFARITAINSSTQLTVSKAMPAVMTNAPYAVVSSYAPSACGVMYAINLHPVNAGYADNNRVVNVDAAFSKTDTQLSISVGTINNWRGLTLPFRVERGSSRPEVMTVTALDFTTRKATVTRGIEGTPVGVSTTASEPLYARIFPRGFSDSIITPVGQTMLGIPTNNLNFTRTANELAIAIMASDGGPAATKWVEQSWNHFIDYALYWQKRQWTGYTVGGANPGYNYGRGYDFTNILGLLGLNALNPGVNLFGDYMKSGGTWLPFYSAPWTNYTVGPNYSPARQMGPQDSGSSRYMSDDFDEGKFIPVMNLWAAGSLEQQWAAFWSGLVGQTVGIIPPTPLDVGQLLEILPYQVAYGVAPGTDYRINDNRAHVFLNKSGDDGYSGLMSKSSWGPEGTALSMHFANRTEDHLGNYRLVGDYIVSKGNAAATSHEKGADLKCPGFQTCIAGLSQAHLQNGIRFDAIPALVVSPGFPNSNVTEKIASTTVWLDQPAGINGVVVNLTSSNSTRITTPARVVIPPGEVSAVVPAIAYNAPTSGNVIFTATSSNSVTAFESMAQSFESSYTPGVSVALSEISCAPTTFASGGWTFCTVTLVSNAPNGGVTVNLSSSDAINFSLPSSLRVRSGLARIQFYVSATASTSTQNTTITASTGIGSPVTQNLTTTPLANTPQTATVAQWMTSISDTAGGTFFRALVATPRSKLGSDYSYVLIDGSKAYLPVRQTSKHFRQLYHSIPVGQRDYIIVRDYIQSSAVGVNKVAVDAYYWGSSQLSNETVNAIPLDTTVRNGATVSHTKTMQSVQLTTKYLVPSDGFFDTFNDHTSSTWAGFTYRAQGQLTTDPVEFLRVEMPYSGTGDTPPAASAFTAGGYRGTFVEDPTCPLVVLMQADPSAGVGTGVSYTTPVYSGTGCHAIDGLSAGTYDVKRNGVTVLTNQAVDVGGLLRFNVASGTIDALQTSSVVPVNITTSSPLPSGVTGTPYQSSGYQIGCSGGVPPYTFSIVSGAFQSGLTLSSSGLLSGTTAIASTVSPLVQCVDSAGTIAGTDNPKTLSLTIDSSVAPLSITTTSVPGCTEGEAYGPISLQATGGVTPYTWSVSSGSLPPGVTLTGNSLTGACTTAGAYSFTVRVTDSNSPAGTATQPLSIVVLVGPLTAEPSSGALPDITYGQPYSTSITLNGGTPPYFVSAGDLPAGINATVAGNSVNISGTVQNNVLGSFSPGLTFTDSSSGSFSANYSVNVMLVPPYTLTVSATAENNSVIVTAKRASLNANNSGVVVLRDSGTNTVVGIATLDPGQSTRIATFNSLPLGPLYTIEAAVSAETGTSSVQSSNVPTEPTGTRVNLPGMGTGNATVWYGSDSSVPNSVGPINCPSTTGCNVDIPATLQKGQIYWVGWQYGTGAKTKPIPFFP